MISYIEPPQALSQLLHALLKRKQLYNMLITCLRQEGAQAIYVRSKLRFALTSFLIDAGYAGKKILLPAYTCQTVAESVKNAGAIPYFYDITKEFQPNLSQISQALSHNNIDAIIISDVYGIAQDIGDVLNHFPQKPLVIADFAHHSKFCFDKKRPWIDVVMFSSSYYKPICSIGCGILCVIKQMGIEDNIYIEDNLLKDFLSTFILFTIKLILKSFIFKILFTTTQRVKSVKKTDTIAYQTLSHAPLVALAQAFICKRNEEEKNTNFKYYRLKLRDLNFFRYDNEATYLSILVKAEHRELLHRKALKKNLFLGRIFGDIAKKDADLFPVASKLADTVLNLPLFSTRNKINKACEILNTIIEKE